MNKEKILTKSREENKGADLVAFQDNSISSGIAGSTALMLSLILNGISIFQYHRALPELWAVFFCYQGTQGIAHSFLLRKHDRKSPALGWLVYGFVMLAATEFAVYRALRLWKEGV